MDQILEQKYLEILTITEKYVKTILTTWKEIFYPTTCAENLERLKNHTEIFFKELLNESIQKKEDIQNEISITEAEANGLKELLNIDFELATIGNINQLPLLEIQMMFDNDITKLRKRLEDRLEIVKELCVEQEELCAELGEDPVTEPQPRIECIQEFENHIKRLKDERAGRFKIVNDLRWEIKEHLNVLEIQEMTTNEIKLLNDKQIILNNENISVLKQMCQNYEKQVQNLHVEIDTIKDNLERYWNCLNVNVDIREKFRSCTEYTQRSYQILHNELERCQTLKMENIEFFIQQLREEIGEWWEKTLTSKEERQFSSFTSENYTEDLLQKHESELENLKQFYLNNKTIFELYATRQQLWEKLDSLDAKANDPNRYNNRGGQLLLEEKERKMLLKKLPKIEQQIAELVQQYLEREHKNFLVFGTNILEKMAKDWGKKRGAKEKPTNNNLKKFTPKRQVGLSTVQLSNKKPTSATVRKLSACTLQPSPATNAYTLTKYSVCSFKRRKLNNIEKANTAVRRNLYPFGATANNVLVVKEVRSTRKSPLQTNRINGATRRSSTLFKSIVSKKRRSKDKENIPEIEVTEARDENNQNADKVDNHFENKIKPINHSTLKPTTSNGEFKRMPIGIPERDKEIVVNEVKEEDKIQDNESTIKAYQNFENEIEPLNRSSIKPITSNGGFKKMRTR